MEARAWPPWRCACLVGSFGRKVFAFQSAQPQAWTLSQILPFSHFFVCALSFWNPLWFVIEAKAPTSIASSCSRFMDILTICLCVVAILVWDATLRLFRCRKVLLAKLPTFEVDVRTSNLQLNVFLSLFKHSKNVIHKNVEVFTSFQLSAFFLLCSNPNSSTSTQSASKSWMTFWAFRVLYSVNSFCKFDNKMFLKQLCSPVYSWHKSDFQMLSDVRTFLFCCFAQFILCSPETNTGIVLRREELSVFTGVQSQHENPKQ